MSCNGIKVLIAAPLKQEPKIFREYQDALDRLIIPDGVTVCIRAACHGFELWVDSHFPAEHLFTEQHYQDFMRRRGYG